MPGLVQRPRMRIGRTGEGRAGGGEGLPRMCGGFVHEELRTFVLLMILLRPYRAPIWEYSCQCVPNSLKRVYAGSNELIFHEFAGKIWVGSEPRSLCSLACALFSQAIASFIFFL